MKSTLGVVYMLKYLSKFAVDILPSVAATVIGAYIVNHYIVAKPATDTPVAAAVSSPTPKSDTVANLPEAGVRAKGISEKAVFDRSGFDQPTEKAAAEKAAAEKASIEKASTEKSADDKPVETASLPADSRKRATPPVREKTAIRTIPLTASSASPAQPATPVVAPSAVPAAAPTVEAAITPEDHRDANDLARAAIERLRGGNETPSVRAPEAATRAPDAAPRVVAVPTSSPQISAPQAVRPLPPPIMVSTPSNERYGDQATGALPMQQPYPSSARIDDPRRPTPPADIPPPPPLNLQADADMSPAQEHRNVAQDMLSAAKSVFHAVLPQ